MNCCFFSMRTPLGFYESSVNLNMVKIRVKIISLCTSAEPKHFIAAADCSLALLFNYMWTYVFHTVFASNSQFPRDIQLSVLYLTNEHCQEQLWRCHLLHKGKNSCQSWPMYSNIFILKELLCWLCCSGGWIIPVYSLHISLLNLYSILGIIRMKGTIKCKVLLKSIYEKKMKKGQINWGKSCSYFQPCKRKGHWADYLPLSLPFRSRPLNIFRINSLLQKRWYYLHSNTFPSCSLSIPFYTLVGLCAADLTFLPRVSAKESSA